MRFVIYDDETMEAITVINLPFTDRDLKFMHANSGAKWRVPVPQAIVAYDAKDDGELRPEIESVTVEFEPFYRHTRRYGEQRSWMAFTNQAELAMLLYPDWLPGQRPTVQMLERQAEFLNTLLIAAVQRGL